MDKNSVSDCFLDLIKEHIPPNNDNKLEYHTYEDSGNRVYEIDWLLLDDPKRPNKRSKKITIKISREALDDYLEDSETNKQAAQKRFIEHIKNKHMSFDPGHNEKIPPEDKWLITTEILNRYG